MCIDQLSCQVQVALASPARDSPFRVRSRQACEKGEHKLAIEDAHTYELCSAIAGCMYVCMFNVLGANR